VERNPLRAGLVERAESWPWSSLTWWTGGPRPDYAEAGPGARPGGGLDWGHGPLAPGGVARRRGGGGGGAAGGSEPWAEATARRLGLEASLRPRGRPRKHDRKT